MIKTRAKWEVAQRPDDATVAKIVEALKVPQALGALVVMRGYDTPEKAKEFLRPSLDSLHDPFLMKDMDVAVELVLETIARGETILVHGDYDVDGQCATTLLTRTLRAGGADAIPFVPHRVRDGYDFGPAGIRAAEEAGATLVITCDCGITAGEAVDDARARGINVIVTDHHIVGELPNANAVLNPKRPDCEYPFKDLCGTGVAFKLAEALIPRLDLPENFRFHLLDLAALATVADIVSLRGENRVVVRHGLKLLAKSNWPGVRALVRSAGITGDSVSAGQVGFQIGPRLNAAGRVGEAMDGVRLLMTDDDAEAASRAAQLEVMNSQRQELDQKALEEAIQMVEEEFDLGQEFGLVLAAEGWHAGVIGIVASRIVERYHRPAVLISVDGEVGKGSCRSIPGFDLHAALGKCADLLEKFGGHKMAAGLTVDKGQLGALRERFNSVVREELGVEDLIPTRRVDLLVSLNEVDDDLENLLSYVEPCGIGNPKPVLAVEQAAARNVRELKGKHLKMSVDDGKGRIEAIGFNWVDRLTDEELDGTVRLAFHLNRNEFRGRSTLQARVVDLGVA
jgi:single-stranded-DNA-specific exonuclease